MFVFVRSHISADLSLGKDVLLYVQRVSIGSVRSAEYVDHSTQSLQRLLYTLSLHLVSTIVTLCWLGRQGPSQTGFNRCSLLNAAAWVVSGTWKFDRGLSQLLHSELHCLDIPRVQYELGIKVCWCLQN